jgi:hypothetical protein
MRRLVGIVEADRPVPDDENKRRETILHADVLENPPDDIGHLAYCESRIPADRRGGVFAIQVEARAHGRCGRPMNPLPAG